MFELRWKVEKWTVFSDPGFPNKYMDQPVLQYRTGAESIPATLPMTIAWSGWLDVPTEYIEV